MLLLYRLSFTVIGSANFLSRLLLFVAYTAEVACSVATVGKKCLHKYKAEFLLEKVQYKAEIYDSFMTLPMSANFNPSLRSQMSPRKERGASTISGSWGTIDTFLHFQPLLLYFKSKQAQNFSHNKTTLYTQHHAKHENNALQSI